MPMIDPPGPLKVHRRCESWEDRPAIVFSISSHENFFHYLNDGFMGVLQTLIETDLLPERLTRCAFQAIECITHLADFGGKTNLHFRVDEIQARLTSCDRHMGMRQLQLGRFAWRRDGNSAAPQVMLFVACF